MILEALQKIAVLYAIEAEGKDMNVAARKQLRQEKSLPHLHTFHEWLIKTRMTVANGGASAKAFDYTLRRWPALIRYAETGHLPIDKNPVENCIRPIALGRKIWLFTGSERAGRRARHPNSVRHSQAEWLKPGGMAKGYLGKNAHLAELMNCCR